MCWITSAWYDCRCEQWTWHENIELCQNRTLGAYGDITYDALSCPFLVELYEDRVGFPCDDCTDWYDVEYQLDSL